jgi:NAD(P)-dependent dehydrogenase (short-subunit alcohol dehydrogenase family)
MIDPDGQSNEPTADIMRPLLAHMHPIKRSGEASDIANMACFLASDESSFVTGQHMRIDGGLMDMRAGERGAGPTSAATSSDEG